MQKFLVIGAALIVVIVIITSGQSGGAKGVGTETLDAKAAVSVAGGKQTIAIVVNKGYSPRSVEAKGGLPTTLVFKTDNTYDCSSSLVVPSLGVKQQLKSTDEFDVTLDPKPGDVLKGTCGMGMYSFAIAFK